MTEGIADALAVDSAETDAVAIVGTGVAVGLRWLDEALPVLSDRRVAVCMDADQAGIETSRTVVEALRAHDVEAVAIRPEGTDLGEWAHRRGRQFQAELTSSMKQASRSVAQRDLADGVSL